MIRQLSKSPKNQFTKARGNTTLLAARVTLINHVFEGALWYILTLGAGHKELEQLEKMIADFLWAGNMEAARHRVKWNTIIFPRSQGGLGIVSVQEQVWALVGKIILWVISPRDHPLQKKIGATRTYQQKHGG